jgi:filamentous hemagglutinin family protein
MAHQAKCGSARRGGPRNWPIFGLALAGLIGGGLASPAAAAPTLPTGGVVQAGSASIGASGSGLTINQSSSRAIIDWTGFSIGSGGAVQFNNGSGATLNRVTGSGASTIDGLLAASGSVYLINPNGVIIGKSGVVDVGGTFAAATLDLSNASFMSGGDLTFSGASTAAVVNYGKIGALGGDVALIAARVENDGEITAANGDVGLAAGYQVVLRDAALDDGKFAVLVGGSKTSATNTGAIAAAEAELRANGGNVYALAGNTSSIIKATGVSSSDGKVFLVADNGGTLDVGGTIQARGAGGAGGFIETSGANVTIGAASLDAGNGGTWLVDPYDLTIDSTAAGTIDTALSGGTSVLLKTTTVGASGAGLQNPYGAGDITIASALTWSSGATLTLDAYHSVAFDANVSMTGGAGGVTILTNDGGSGGTLSFAPGKSLTFASGAQSLNINGAAYTLEFSQANLYTALTGATASDHYALGASIAFSGGAAASAPVTSFAGTLEGLGNSFSGLTITQTTAGNNVGLIGSLTGTVADLNLTSVAVSDSYTGATVTGIGALAGTSTGTIRNVTVTGSVTGSTTSTEVGGVVGFASGGSPYGIFGSSFNGSVTGNSDVGGLAGLAFATITGDWSAGTVTGTGSSETRFGGLLGEATYQVAQSYSTSNVTASAGQFVGGLVGDNNGGAISDSFASGSVTATGGTSVGGFAGANENTASISNAYSTGAVSTGASSTNTGGFVGLNSASSTIQYAYTTGTATSTGTNKGAFAGNNSATIANAVYDTSTAGGLSAVGTGVSPVGLVGETTTQMQDSSAYATNFAGFDFTNTWSPPSSGYFPQLFGVSHVVRLTADNSSMTYGDALSTNLPLSVLGLQGGDTIGDLTGVSFTTLASNTASIGAYAITPNGGTVTGPTGVYRVVGDVGGTLTINARPVTVSLTGTVEKTYDGTTVATLATSNFNITNVVNSDAVDIASYTAAYASQNVVDNTSLSKGVVNVNGLVLGGAGSGNYVLANPGQLSGNVGVIDPRSVTPLLVGLIEKTYDDNTNAVMGSSNYSFSNIIVSDAGNLTLSAPTGSFDTKDAGVGKTVTFTGLALGGSAAPNYVLSSTTFYNAVGKIDPLHITASLVGATTKVYDGTTTATMNPGGYSLATVFGGDTVTLSAAAGDYYNSGTTLKSKTVAGTDTVQFSNLSLGGAQAGDYVLDTTTMSGAGTITARPLTLALVGNVTKTYDGTTVATLTPTNYSVSNIVPGDSVSLNSPPTVGTYASPNAGTGINVTVAGAGLSLTGADAPNYTIAAYVASGLSGLIGTINAAGLSVTLTGTVEKTYDGTNTATLTAANYILNGAPSGITLNDPTTGTYDNPNAGTHKQVSVSGLALLGTGASNFYLSPTIAGPIGIIDPKVITASLTGTISKTYDGTTNALLGTNYAFSYGSGANQVLASDSALVGLGASVGNYDTKDVTGSPTKLVTFTVFMTGVHGADYSIVPTLSGNVGQILPKTISAGLTGTIEKTYDGTRTATLGNNYSFSGAITADLPTLGLTAASGLYDTKDVGSGKTVTFTGLSLTGTSAVDYTISPTTISAAIGKIDPKTITAAVQGVIEKTYDGNTTATLGSLNYNFGGGVYGGDTVTLTGVGTYDTKNAGSNKLVRFNSLALGGAQAFDYKLSTTTMTGTTAGKIDPKPVFLTQTGVVEKVYDATTKATLTPANYTVTGMVAGDGLTVSTTSGVYNTKNAGSGLLVNFTGVTLTGANAPNYTLNSNLLTGWAGKIDPKSVTVSLVGSVTKFYDGTTSASLIPANYLVVGFVAGDTVSLNNPSHGTYATAAKGTGIVVTVNGVALQGASMNNYVMTNPTTLSAAIGTIK